MSVLPRTEGNTCVCDFLFCWCLLCIESRSSPLRDERETEQQTEQRPPRLVGPQVPRFWFLRSFSWPCNRRWLIARRLLRWQESPGLWRRAHALGHHCTCVRPASQSVHACSGMSSPLPLLLLLPSASSEHYSPPEHGYRRGAASLPVHSLIIDAFTLS